MSLRLKICLYLGLFAIPVLNYSQVLNPNIKVNIEELELQKHPKYNDAHAIVVYDYGNVYLNDVTYEFELVVRQKIKILTKKGLNRGQKSIKLSKSKTARSKISKITGATHNLVNNEIIVSHLDKSSIFVTQEKHFDKIDIVMPSVKVGSIITLSYTISSPFYRKLFPWYFQGKDPVIHSEFHNSIPANFKYNAKLVGSIPLDSTSYKVEKQCLKGGSGEVSDCAKATFVMKNIPSFKPELHMTAPDNFMSRIEYELESLQPFNGRLMKFTNSWEDITKDLKTNLSFSRQIWKTRFIREELSEDIVKSPTSLKKAEQIRDHVLSNYRWNSEYGGLQGDLKELSQTHVGSANELNLYLYNLLLSQGFEVYPVLISTRKNGDITSLYPVITDFNYIAVQLKIDSKSLLLDATDPFVPFGMLPFELLNKKGRQVNFNGKGSWISLDPELFSTNQIRVKAKVIDGLKIDGTLSELSTGYLSITKRKAYTSDSKAYKTSRLDLLEDFETKNIDIHSGSMSEDSFLEQLQVSFSLDDSSPLISINPFFIQFYEKNPFLPEERLFPVNFGYKTGLSYSIILDLNDRFEVVELPEELNYNLPNEGGSLKCNFNLIDGSIIALLKVNLNKSEYSQSEYKSLKTLFEELITLQKNGYILLKRL